MTPTQSPPEYYRLTDLEGSTTQSSNQNVENSTSATNSENPRRLCNLEMSKWFLIHSIVVSILYLPVLYITAPYHGLVIIPFTYTAILLAAAIWKKVPALQVVITVAIFKLLACAILFVSVPVLVSFEAGTRYIPAGRGSFRRAVFEVTLEVMVAEILVLALTTCVLSQIALALEVLSNEMKRKNGNGPTRNAANIL